MKKKIIVLLAALCVVSLVGGCGTKKEDSNQKKQETQDSKDNKGSGSLDESSLGYDLDECVDLGEYMGLKLTVATRKVTDEDVKSSINSMLTSYEVYEETDKTTVEEGDVANIDYEGVKDGVAFDGGTAQGANLIIGSNSFIDGFEDGLIGKKVGEKVKLELTFPENYGNPELNGKEVIFNVTVNKILKTKTYDTVTDKDVTTNFSSQGYENVKDLEKGVKEQLETSNESTKETETENMLFQELHNNCKVDVPEDLLKEKVDDYIEQFTSNIQTNYGVELKDYLSTINTTEEEFKEQVEQMVKESLENQMILEAIAKKEKIELDDEEFTEYKNDIISQYGYEDEEDLVEQFGEAYLKNAFLSEKTLDILIDNAVITYEEKDTSTDSTESEKEEEGDKEEENDKEEEKE